MVLSAPGVPVAVPGLLPCESVFPSIERAGNSLHLPPAEVSMQGRGKGIVLESQGQTPTHQKEKMTFLSEGGLGQECVASLDSTSGCLLAVCRNVPRTQCGAGGHLLVLLFSTLLTSGISVNWLQAI